MKKIGILMAIVGVLSFLVIGCGTSLPPEQKFINQLTDAYNSQSLTAIKEAASQLENLISKDNPTYMQYYNAALGQFKIADYLDLKAESGVDKSGEAEKACDTARDYLKKSIELKSDFYDAYYLKNGVLGKKFGYVGFPRLMKYVGEISQDLQSAIDLAPDDARTKLLEGIASANSFPAPEPQETIDMIKEALKINPEFSEAYYHIALTELKRNGNDEAIKNLKKAIETDQYNFWAKKKLAEIEK